MYFFLSLITKKNTSIIYKIVLRQLHTECRTVPSRTMVQKAPHELCKFTSTPWRVNFYSCKTFLSHVVLSLKVWRQETPGLISK